MKKSIIMRLLLAALFLFPLCAAAADEDTKIKEAIVSAEEFLLLVDTSQYDRSWDAASSYFREQVDKNSWVKQISSLRPAFGKIINRDIRGAHFTTELPGAPDGEYVVIQYDTTFENKRKAIETVTPMLDKDGRWRVSGYYIQ